MIQNALQWLQPYNTIETMSVLVGIGAIFVFVGLVLKLLFVLPLQYEQAKVQNGLVPLRRDMLQNGKTQFVLGVLILSSFLIDIFVEHIHLLVGTRAVLMGISFAWHAFVPRRIYRHQFSTEQKGFHRKVAKLEKEHNKKP